MGDPDSATVLVVEDDREVAATYVDLIGDAYRVRVAHDAGEAIESLDAEVDVVLLDRRLPDASGDTVLEEVQGRELDIRVVVISAVTPDFDIVGMGFDDYLLKPVSRDELHATIEAMLARTAYHGLVREYLRLTAKHAVLETHKTDAELDDSAEFAKLESRLAEVRAELDETASGFSPADFRALYQQLV